MANASILAAFERMWQHITIALNNKQTKHVTATAIIAVDNWANMTQIVSVDGITGDNTIIVTPVSSNQTAYSEASVCCSAQGNGSLTFECAKVPTEELAVNILILN